MMTIGRGWSRCRHLAGCIAAVGMAVLLSACAAMGEYGNPAITEKTFTGDPTLAKDIFVFLDGTRNDSASGTNVRQVFDAVFNANDAQTSGIYIEGVGSVDSPLLGASLGFGMEPRILRGYDFIAQAFRPGDKLYIFGFSRGAHQARALAGLIAYAGVPARSEDNMAQRLKRGNAILEVVKAKNDADYMDAWRTWRPGQEPIAAKELHERFQLHMEPAEVQFLGVWDTVPGSLFKDFGVCKELNDRREGDRYKSDSYPPIRRILHAVSRDEKRSRFHPLLLCPSINANYTQVSELWFPGSHADIGGGYADSRALSDLSLAWMMAGLAQDYALPPLQLAGDPLGVAHWSIGDWPGNLFSHCEDRTKPDDGAASAGLIARETVRHGQLNFHGVIDDKPYPLLCPR
ncbi:phospholipase effector Tle1 domain-containing protein [Janthinobacterium sp. ZB1P44]|uniref:phospholipase effector Tle1 domain-containing protein n=1 Tax=Janthinobacterium sp. ZB1P44 TaxID=3424192 RepID=UPI003F295080